MNKLEQKLAKIDLNLIVALSVLLKERSVSKAADILFITQPAMSKTLNRLRVLFDDPLFHRTPTGIVPSETALALEKKIPKVLNTINSLFHKKVFSPEICEQSFTISVPSLLANALLQPFILKIKQFAPNVCISDFPVEADPFPALENGKYDFAIHTAIPTNHYFGYTSLGFAKPNVFARKNHPLTKGASSNKLEHLAQYKFIEYQVGIEESKSFENSSERITRLFNFKPDITCKSSNLDMIIALLESSDSLFIAPEFMNKSREFADKFTSVFEFDIKQEDMLEIVLLESPRAKHSEAEQWLKQELLMSINI